MVDRVANCRFRSDSGFQMSVPVRFRFWSRFQNPGPGYPPGISGYCFPPKNMVKIDCMYIFIAILQIKFSKFCMKNWAFWGTLCWYSSNSKRMGGGQFLQILPHRPLLILLSFELLQHSVPQKNRFLMYNLDLRKRCSLKVKNLKKIEFSH